MIFVGDEKMAESKMMFLPVNVVTLGYVARRKNDACNARYQLNIRVRLNHDDLSKGPTDKGGVFQNKLNNGRLFRCLYRTKCLQYN